MQEFKTDKPKVVDLQQFDMYFGDEANEIVQSEDESNRVPAAEEQWILMGFDISLYFLTGRTLDGH
ncbi:hypothetical protein [Bacillus sp. ISL-46]|uniref:hypothetical protein n=1 Tax=Bacillus sp. ISL-46 TaxID=2819129 RepID=UPI001BE88DBF|nr:hypothetical protein [Bacillus sp. ISL-46]MBT2722770.1 hypothetical protein [Bacillus sp. ISL-46]